MSDEERAEVGRQTMQVLFQLSSHGEPEAAEKLRERWTVIDGGEPEAS